MANSKIDYTTLDLKEDVVDTRRVSKTVKGGTIKRWASVVVVGDAFAALADGCYALGGEGGHSVYIDAVILRILAQADGLPVLFQQVDI